MSIEAELASKIYRLEELHNQFVNGEFEEMNALYADDFQGMLYMPSSGKIETYNAKQIRKGNEDAANYYKGKSFKFIFSGLKIVSQSEDQAAVSYEVTHLSDNRIIRAISLEVWKKINGSWKMIRWYEEKGKAILPEKHLGESYITD
ncbi:nuclear transport factor 2 family protein [Paenibacillus lactis]|uniref:nuclear transport factor 2 family protein n=1 Tax=Paenibacillus lactis TaxID=228574 RepID=UPI00119F1031